MDVSAYLDRIGYNEPLKVDIGTLRALHMAHMLSVPFENLSIAVLHQPIVLDEGALYDKIVTRRRGGFCYELNGLFGALLRTLGFNVTLLSARVVGEAGHVSPEFDHLALQVQLSEPWLADVGFGGGFRYPLRLFTQETQVADGVAYRILEDGSDRILQQQEAGDWRDQYRFTLQPRTLQDFAGMCQYHQSSPESTFTRRRICTLATPDGRVTLSDMRLIITRSGQREEQLVRDETEYDNLLRKYFAIVIAR